MVTLSSMAPKTVLEPWSGSMHRTRPPVKGRVRKNSPRARRRWENAAVTTAAPPQGHHGRIAAVALTELDGQRLVVSAGEDGMVAAWEVEGSATPHIVVASGGTATALTVATRRKEPVVVTGWGDGSVTVHDLRS